MPKEEQTFYLSKWLLTDAEAPVFEAADICGLTGISSQTLQNWANRKVVSPTPSRRGKGGIRRYDKLDACSIKVARGLVTLGLEASGAMRVSRNALAALVSRICETSVSDVEFAQMVACIFVDPFNRQQAVILSTIGKKVSLEEAEPMRMASESIFIEVGKQLWELYKADAALYNENQMQEVPA